MVRPLRSGTPTTGFVAHGLQLHLTLHLGDTHNYCNARKLGRAFSPSPPPSSLGKSGLPLVAHNFFNILIYNYLISENKPGTWGQASNGIQEHYADRFVSE